tara:strand:+ start:7 stop:1509 length:1503 start_codon:yes stop_codon:yes gene_type:complete
MIRMLIIVLSSINLFYLAFSQDAIEGRWIGTIITNTMYEFVDTELFADAGLRYTIYSSDGSFGSIEDAIPNPKPYWVDGNTISIGYANSSNIVTYAIDYRCDGQVVDFYYDEDDDWEGLHSSMFREGFDYVNSECSDSSEGDCVCTGEWDPICGVDGNTYSNACYAECKYVVIAYEGECQEVLDECFDFTNIDFGDCDMVLGIGLKYDECSYISGCDWIINGVDYSDLFFYSMDECEGTCSAENMTCEEIMQTYEELHLGEYATCEFDNDCMTVWGDCDVGLGGCHYSINADNYIENQINELVDMWNESDCMAGVCDCASEPYAQCIDGTCASAYCMSENPAGCFQTGCEEGFECVVVDNECNPSWCGCDDFYGSWYCTEDCSGGSCVSSIIMGDLNYDSEINIIDVILLVNTILDMEYNNLGDLNDDGESNIVDVVNLVNLILNPLNEDCYIVPEVGPCEGICPTYYFNQNTNQCEEFITGCCGIEAFNTMQGCIDVCE